MAEPEPASKPDPDPQFGTAAWFRQMYKGRAKCLKCGKKGVGQARHPHALGCKDYSRCKCRYCNDRFETPDLPR